MPRGAVPEGGEWIHEIKYDGYRRRRGKVSMFTRRGHDWTDTFAPRRRRAESPSDLSAFVRFRTGTQGQFTLLISV
jgi:ATP-dependent DNA ligase